MTLADKLAALKALKRKPDPEPVARQELAATVAPPVAPVAPSRAKARAVSRGQRKTPHKGKQQPASVSGETLPWEDTKPVAPSVVSRRVKDPQPAPVPAEMGVCVCCRKPARSWYEVERADSMFKNGVQVSRLTPVACCSVSCAREIADPMFKAVPYDPGVA